MGGHSYYLSALRLLDYMEFAMEVSTEWKMEGGTHSSSTALGLGIPPGDKCPHTPPPPPNRPQFSEFFVWGWEGAQKCFILGDQTTGDLKSHHLQAWVTLRALSVPQGHIFFQQSCNAFPIMQYSQYHLMREKRFTFLMALMVSSGGGGARAPQPHPPPPPWVRHWLN